MAVDLEKEKKIISDFLQSIGPWRNHIVIGGGYALFIYKLYLAEGRIEYPPVGTRDLDSLVPRKIPNTPAKKINEFLRDAGFKLIYKDQGNPATEAYAKNIAGTEVEVEFLTDAAVRKNKTQNILIEGIVAQPLSYIKLSLEKTIPFKTATNEIGFVVSPGAWVFHKGLTFPKRTSGQKVYKDLYGIWYASSQLGDFSASAVKELLNYSHLYPKWFQTFRGNLRNWIEEAIPLDWAKLEAQDPFGKLKKLGFENLAKRLLDSIID